MLPLYAQEHNKEASRWEGPGLKLLHKFIQLLFQTGNLKQSITDKWPSIFYSVLVGEQDFGKKVVPSDDEDSEDDAKRDGKTVFNSSWLPGKEPR